MEPKKWLRKSYLPALSCLALSLAGAHAAIAVAGPAEGKTLFESKKCTSCHQMSGPVATVPVAERAKIKGPPLWFAGSKFQKEWLINWLEKPTPIRRVRYGTLQKDSNEHAALSAAEAQQVGAYLMSLTDPALKTGVVGSEKLSRRAMFQAQKLFAKKQVCYGCHLYPSAQGDIGGFSGPSLVAAGKRLQADWIYAFLKDPARYYPNGRMPVYGSQAFNAFTDEEFQRLAQYVGDL